MEKINSSSSPSDFTTYRTCPLCEATCGLAITYKKGKAVSVRGDKKDVFSKGYLCPKGAALAQLHDDPDRLRHPLIRTGSTFREASWEDAFEYIENAFMSIVEKHGRDAVAAYLGNPCSHMLAANLCGPIMLRALNSKNIYSASTVDQMPRHVSCGFMFGSPVTIPVPDIDRSTHLIILGANPMASNGLIATAPDFPGRLRALKKRGGKIVVIDPRRTRTAKLADEYIAIRPGSDIFLLLAMANVLFAEKKIQPGRLAEHINGLDAIEKAVVDFTPESVQNACGIPADVIRRLAGELAAAENAAVYGRMGISVNRFGTAANWMVDVLNILTGNLDRPGGVMFPLPVHMPLETKPDKRKWLTGRWKSRVKGIGEIKGEFPIHTLCDEIETPGKGQIKALLTVAGNPAISLPNSARVDKALAGLDLMISVDYYVNASTRHAHVILPPTGPLTTAHFDIAFYNFAVRNIANYSPPDLPKPSSEMDLWEILYKLSAIFKGLGAATDISVFDDMTIENLVSNTTGRSEEILTSLKQYRGPDRILDLMIRTGAYGDGFGRNPEGLNLEKLKTHFHGLDMGPLKPRIPGILNTPSGKIELAPPLFINDLERIASELIKKETAELLLIGRRHLRTNNSWLANIPSLVAGSSRCTLQVHPEDAARIGLTDGGMATISSRTGTLTVPVEITQDLRPGVVCFPHGWGHDQEGVAMNVARKHGGINTNLITDEAQFDPVSGNSLLNGVPVTVVSAA